MLARTVALALVGSAAAFSPMMSMDMGRRQVVQAGAAAAVAAPLLRANPASAGMDKSAKAPAITIMDHRGCTAHANKEYTGPAANAIEDEMCVVVRNPKVTVSELEAGKFLQSVISFQAKGIDGPYTGVGKI
jgi:hypothetical protein